MTIPGLDTGRNEDIAALLVRSWFTSKKPKSVLTIAVYLHIEWKRVTL